MNHGYCKNCWWYKESQKRRLISVPIGVKGICYMQSKNVGIEGAELLKEVTSVDYCPDYINRAKEVKYGGKTLDEWIAECYENQGKQGSVAE